MRKLSFILLFLVLSSALFAQKWLWGAQGSSGSDTYATATDSKGNAYLAGYFATQISFGSYSLTSFGLDSYLVKYDSVGNVIWAVQSKIPSKNSSAQIVFICTDNIGNILATGIFQDTVSFGSFKLIAPSFSSGIFIVKFDINGNVLWAKDATTLPYGGYSHSYSVATDKTGNVYITGVFFDTITFGAYTLTTPRSYSYYGDLFLAKYDVNGNLIWAKEAVIPSRGSGSIGYSVCTDNSNNVYVTGGFADTALFGTYTLITKPLHNVDFGDIFLAKYDTNGNVLWAKQATVPSGSSSGVGYSVVTDKDENVYITGDFVDTITFGSSTLITASPGGYLFLTKYDANGNVLWAKQSYNTSFNSSEGYCLAADNFNNIYLSGGCSYGYIVFGNDTFSNYNYNDDPSIIMKLDTGGNVLCGSLITSGGDDANGIAVSPSGRYIYLGGDLGGKLIFGADTLRSDSFSGEIPFIARWQPCDIPVDTIPVDTIPAQEPCTSLFIPNAFSPNKDGRNDILYVRGSCINTMDFVIYDRWGNKVFESTNINYGWDGTYKGENENTAVFAYYLHATLQDGSMVDKKGNVSLIR
jgi:gliding motility-associated-like protein